MQLSKLLTPKLDTRSNNSNGPGIFGFGLPQIDCENQDQTNVMANIDYMSLQPLRYNAGHVNNADDDYDNYDDGCHISIRDLRNNDKDILSLLNEEMGSTYSFKALERKLDIHQQSLTRALKRLRHLDLVEKTPNGYRTTKNKNAFLPNTTQENSLFMEEEKAEIEETEVAVKPELSYETRKTRKRFSQLIQISIPIRSNIDLIINHLVGKWFGNLRWFGLVKKEAGVTLQWIAISKYNNKDKLFQINVNIVSEYVVIECNAVSDKEKVEAMSCSNRIVGEIIKTLQDNLQEECEIPDEFATPKDCVPTHTNKVKHIYKKNN
jgi:DNA-binding HxlR family transcriptional regulator